MPSFNPKGRGEDAKLALYTNDGGGNCFGDTDLRGVGAGQ
jgi:hypothetical protein